jgi:myosin heavy subunit
MLVANKVAQLLGMDGSKFQKALTSRTMRIKGQAATSVALKPEQANDARDGFSKGLYGRMFNWLVDFINQSINVAEAKSFIGVLDIFG